jgi:hypothetical protein
MFGFESAGELDDQVEYKRASASCDKTLTPRAGRGS